MPDVMHETARTDYDDAIEIGGDLWECEDIVGVATFPVDRAWDGTPTGQRDPLPIRVYTLTSDDEFQTASFMAYLSIGSARELRDALDAAIVQVELTRDPFRRRSYAERTAL